MKSTSFINSQKKIISHNIDTIIELEVRLLEFQNLAVEIHISSACILQITMNKKKFKEESMIRWKQKPIALLN